MSLLCDAYIFYGDIYFLQNFLIKMTILFLISYSLKIQSKVSVLKIVLIAGAGTLFEMIGLLYVCSYEFFIALVHLFEVPCMVLMIVGKHRTLLIKGVVLGYLYIILENGVLEVLWNMFGENGHYWLLLILSCVVVVFGTIHYLQCKKLTKGIYSVELVHGDVSLETKAFYDSGNRLQDPYTQKGVHIISEKLIKELSITEEKKVYIPYHSLGNANGLMDVVYLDEILIYGNKETVRQQKVPVGITKEDMFFNKSYEMILNEEVF